MLRGIDWGDVLLHGLIALLAIVLLGGTAFLVTDSVQTYRAFNARVECEAHRMVPRRQMLSSKVVCVPTVERRDTVTVNGL